MSSKKSTSGDIFFPGLPELMEAMMERIDIIIKRYGSQKDFAKAINVSKITISRWKHRKNFPERSNVEQIAKIAKVSPEWIYFGDDPQQRIEVQKCKDSIDRAITGLDKSDRDVILEVIKALGQDPELRATVSKYFKFPKSRDSIEGGRAHEEKGDY